MYWFRSLFRKKDNPAPLIGVLDDYIKQKLERLIEDVILFDTDKQFVNREEVIDFISEKLNLFRSVKYIVEQKSLVPKKNLKNKLKPLTDKINRDKVSS